MGRHSEVRIITQRGGDRIEGAFRHKFEGQSLGYNDIRGRGVPIGPPRAVSEGGINENYYDTSIDPMYPELGLPHIAPQSLEKRSTDLFTIL